MSRDGSGVYTLPGGFNNVKGVALQPVESGDYNTVILDFEADANIARPVVAGGTGGNSPATARDGIDAEVAAQLVTNYDTHVFEAGSFYNSGSTPGAPVGGQSFAGTCTIMGGGDIVLEAFSRDDGRRYIRRKSGTWGVWVAETVGLVLLQALNVSGGNDATFVNLTNAFEKYVIECIDVLPNGTQAVELHFSSDNGASWVMSNYASHMIFGDMSANTVNGVGNNGSGTGLNVGIYILNTGATKRTNITIELPNPAGLKDPMAMWRAMGWASNGNFFCGQGAGTRLGWGAAAYNAVRIRAAAGTISGQFKLYGQKKAWAP
jgi:hypothetical protein